jgi:hypothetical protein
MRQIFTIVAIIVQASILYASMGMSPTVNELYDNSDVILAGTIVNSSRDTRTFKYGNHSQEVHFTTFTLMPTAVWKGDVGETFVWHVSDDQLNSIFWKPSIGQCFLVYAKENDGIFMGNSRARPMESAAVDLYVLPNPEIRDESTTINKPTLGDVLSDLSQPDTLIALDTISGIRSLSDSVGLVVPLLSSMLRKRTGNESRYAAMALTNLGVGANEAIPDLVWLKGNGNVAERKAALWALVYVERNADARADYAASGLSDTSYEVRSAAVGLLWRLSTWYKCEAVCSYRTLLQSMSETDADERIKARAMSLLAELDEMELCP